MDDNFCPVIPNISRPLKVHRFRKSKGGWRHASKREDGERPIELRIATWNVDFNSKFPVERIKVILDHLRVDVFNCPNGERPEPCCIVLQEVSLEMIEVISNSRWVREHFYMTPVSADKWPGELPYTKFGNVTLVERSIRILQAKFVEYGLTAMNRAALVVDLRLGKQDRTGPGKEDFDVRLINTHLESLQEPKGTHPRENQMGLCASLLEAKYNIRGGLIVGDMNPIGENDQGLPAKCGLRDAWWRMAEGEKEAGYTWGFQGGGDFPPGRFDKILFSPRRGFRVTEPERIGVGLMTDDGSWASDHYGLVCKVFVL